jgi:carboxylesterase
MTENKYMHKPQLDGDEFFWKGNQVCILLIHGFTATTTEVRLMAEKLHGAGLTTVAPLLPGHGTHPDDLNRATWYMWVQKVKETYECLLENYQEIFILGTSMGALLSLELATQHPEIAGLLLFSPTLKVDNLWLAPFFAPFMAYLKKQPKDDHLPWKGYNVYPLKATNELYKLQKHVKSILPKIDQPMLVFSGVNDTRISNEAIAPLLTRVNSVEKQHIQMQNSGHFVMLEDDLDEAYKLTLNFIAKHSSFSLE